MQKNGRRIGLLGGSFNPAHAGHVHIALEAKKQLNLSEVWWLVAPHNPLKSAADLVSYPVRVAQAKSLTAPYPFIHVSTIEEVNHWRYSIDTVRGLKRLYPTTRFVWLMGADNLAYFHRWRDWQSFAFLLPIAIFDRAPFTFLPLASKFAHRFKQQRICERARHTLTDKSGPAWCFIHMRRHEISATFLRKTLGENAFLPHTDI